METLAERLITGGVDWRYPDEEGLSERVLDCRQSSIKEVLRWKGYDKLIRIFLNRFDCYHSGLLLRRSEPQLMMGWGLTTHSPFSPEGVRSMIRSVFQRIGYCLLFSEAYHMPFSTYYERYEIMHWSLVIDCDDQGMTLVDDSGHPAFFQGYVGNVPWSVLAKGWRRAGDGGVAYLIRDAAPLDDAWPAHCRRLIADSVTEMATRCGLDHLAGFIKEVERSPLSAVVSELERLEFDLNYFRKARELWRLAVSAGEIPANLLGSDWSEQLSNACQAWSLVMGVAMKWRRQPERDYRNKLVGYLWQAYERERAMIGAMAETLKEVGEA
ncbi:MAG: hypothetical protein H0Z34_03320 [Brevibacillus sp.]|nr:hypothetical protein [Brevibacillus sp.]